MRYAVFCSAALLSLAATHTATAAEFGNKGDVSFGADRLTGFYWVNDGTDGIDLNLGASSLYGWRRPYGVTRLGIDGFPIDHLSIGGNIGLWHAERDRGPGDDSRTGFMIYPRVGYAFMFSRVVGFWPRGGVTFSTDDGNDELALTFEAAFFAAPVEHFGFHFGPNVDIGLVGDGEEAVSIGIITGGVFGWL